jgi:hypothetical protein
MAETDIYTPPETTDNDQDADDQDAGVIEPGSLGPVDYSVEQNADLSEPTEKWVCGFIRTCMLRDTASHRFEVAQAWEARQFNRGYQYLLPRPGGGWCIPGNSSGFGGANQQAWATLYETNIYGAHGDIVTSALTRDFPTCRFEPGDPSFDPDITAAHEANKFKDIFARNCDLKSLYVQAASYGWTDGRIVFDTRFVIDGQRYGYEDAPLENPVVPEDEEQPSTPEVQGQEGQEEINDVNESAAEPAVKQRPRGMEQVDVYGKLETKMPNVQTMAEMNYLGIRYEVDESTAKGMFSDIADKIKPGGNGDGSTELDRIARMNCQSSLASQYVSGENLNKDVTISKTWLRPCNWLVAPAGEIRNELLKAFPNGCVVVQAADTFCYARPEVMEDRLHVMQMFPGSGQNRAALGTKCISVQKRLNILMDLIFEYFVTCVPQKWMDNIAFNIEALKSQPNKPGGIHPFQRQPGVPFTELCMIEPVPQQNPAMMDFINFLFSECMQMLSAALPSLFGAQSNVDTPTVGASAMQRDQALARLSSPWGAFQAATACIYRQAVQCAARCRTERGETEISQSVEGQKVVIEISDLKGNVLVFPDVDSNIPETPAQSRARIMMMMSEGQNNPMLVKLFTVASNQRELKDAIGLSHLVFPEQVSADKQLGEIEILLKSGPQPNPQIMKIKEAVQQGQVESAKEGPEGIQKFQQMLPQMMQAMQQLPPLVPTVQIDEDIEDHATEMATCDEWLLGIEGRKFKAGDEQQQAAWQNVKLHRQLHNEANDKKIAKAKADAQIQPKPPTISISSKDLPAKEAAEAAQMAGIKDAEAADFGAKAAADAQSKIFVKTAEKNAQSNIQ